MDTSTHSLFRAFQILSFSLVLAACGGGGGGGSSDSGNNDDGNDNGTDEGPDTTGLIQDQTLSGLVFSSEVQLVPEHTASGDLTFNVTTSPDHGTLEVSENNEVTYEPTSAIPVSDGDSFVLQVSDGEETDSATITLSFADDTPSSVATLTPMDDATNVSLQPSVTVQLEDPMDPATLSYNNSDGSCTGSLQISADGFSECVGIASASFSDFDRVLELTLDSELIGNTEYEVNATSDFKDRFGGSVTVSGSYSFKTAVTELMITEVSTSVFSNDTRWFEVYNPTGSTLNLDDYQLRTPRYYDDAADTTVTTDHLFSLPSTSVSPGEYLVVRAQTVTPSGWSSVPPLSDSDRVVYVADGDLRPAWYSQGAIELVKQSTGKTADFVTFGISEDPVSSSAWSGGAAPALPNADESDLGKGIARSHPYNDSNTADDWESVEWLTAGGPNDVTCTEDLDQDGIPDCSEVSGSTLAGLPLYEWGARQGQRDIFIEIDYMEPTNSGGQAADEALMPQRAALDKVVDAFADQNIAVHFDAGDYFDQAPGTDPSDYDLGGGEEVPFAAGITIGSTDSRADLYDYKNAYMDYNRLQVFHYMVLGNSQEVGGGQGPSGLGEIHGNDFLVTLGDYGFNTSDATNTNYLVNLQASTIMHELGHNLGLRHGGDENQNYKPNYASIMNYLYSFQGLPTIGDDEGDRYYDENFEQPNSCFSGLTNPNSSSDMIIDFSHGESVDINLSNIDESLGLGRVNSSSVDYDCDGTVPETGVSVVVDPDNGGFSGTSSDYDDWGNIDLVFQRRSPGNNEGPAAIEEEDGLLIMPTTVGDDRSPVAKEWTPNEAFFERLRRVTGTDVALEPGE